MTENVSPNQIQILELIGRGYFTKVHKVKRGSSIIAIKYSECSQQSFKRISELYSKLACIDHENVLQFYGTSQSNCCFVRTNEILMEYADCGSLYNYLYKVENRHYETAKAIDWMIQAAEGIAYLHDIKPTPIIHGNLKPQNMFLTNNFSCLKIGELGIEDEYSKVRWFKKWELLAYMAPETLKLLYCDGDRYRAHLNKNHDIYSFGMVLWEVLSRRKPFYMIAHPHWSIWSFWENTDNFVKYWILSCYLPPLKDVSDEVDLAAIYKLITSCWDLEPDRRPNIKTVALSLRVIFNSFDTEEIPVGTEAVELFQNVELGEVIGRGGFGIVYKARFLDSVFAVKKCWPNDDEAKKYIEREVKQLSRVTHENIIKMYGTTEDSHSMTLLLMEYADCGTLADYIHREGAHKRSYTYLAALNWMQQCAKGVGYLHAMKPKPVIHRDLKPHNLLLTNKFRTLKISDFGTVRDLASRMTRVIGTVAYMAPEVARGQSYTEKSDIYSLGIVLWEVMSQQKPFSHLGNNEPVAILHLVTKGGVRPLISAVKNYPNAALLKSLIENCWNDNPDERKSMQQLSFLLNIDLSIDDLNFLDIKSLPEPTESDYPLEEI